MNSFEQIRRTLSPNQPFGVWSLIVTLFGDMAHGHQHSISGTVLTAVCEKLEIKPPAVRVALHRLRKDGWINSTKAGRKSTYFLTEPSRIESADAAPRIYAQDPPPYIGTNVLFAPSEITKDLSPDHWITARNEIYVSFQTDSISPNNAMLLQYTDEPPDWLRTRLISPDLVTGYQDFERRLKAVSVGEWPQLTPLEIVALRMLLVHGWRRLVLKHPPMPKETFPPNCPISECYEKVGQLLNLLPRPGLDSVT